MKETSKETESKSFIDELEKLKKYLVNNGIELSKEKVVKAAKSFKISKKRAVRYYEIMRGNLDEQSRVGYESMTVKIDKILKSIKTFYKIVKRQSKH